MCGIVGYTGCHQAQPILLEGLKRLEYRGYDSAGIAIPQADGSIGIRKCAGRIAQLEKIAAASPLAGFSGIGHTRWATHGEPSDINAHPHTDVKGDIAIVHNGIIENHRELQKYLEGQGCRFVSQTDTEAIAHLIHTLYRGDMLCALSEAMRMLEGNYALAVICRKEPNTIFCTRHGSPLVIGTGAKEMILASDIPALLPMTRDVILLEEDQIAQVQPGSVKIFDRLLQPLPVIPRHISWDAAAAEKGGFAHFMLKEIMEQPSSVSQTLSAYRKRDQIRAMLPFIPEKIDFVACGTAYHACRGGTYYLARLAGIEARAFIASEYRYFPPFPFPHSLTMAVSQSGETADTLAALKEAGKTAPTAALTNTVGSTLSRLANHTLLTFAGPEIAVASTKAYTTQLETLLLLSIDLGKRRGHLAPERVNELLAGLQALPGQMEAFLQSHQAIQEFCDRKLNERSLFFIGRGMDHSLAMEGALKLKEVAYLPCEAYAAGELKHGPIALIEKGTPVFALCTQENTLEKNLANLRETKARGAETICICPEAMERRALQDADRVWTIPNAPEPVLPLLSILPLQLLAYYSALARGLDVDKPRNLAKSVTVE